MSTDDQEVGANTSAGRAAGYVERGLLVAGLVLFFVLLHRLGVGAVWENLLLIGWGFAPIIGQEMAAIAFNTLGWRWAFPPPRPDLPFFRLAVARLAGDAINNVTPTATMGGELIRARMLGAPDSSTVWASVAIAKISQAFSQIVFIGVGMALVIDTAALPAGFHRALLIGVGLLAISLVLAIALQRRGMFVVGVGLLERLGLPVPVHVGDRLRKLDAEVARFYSDPRPFLVSCVFFLGAWLMGVVEVYLMLHFLEVGASWRRAFTIEVLSTSIDAVLFFVPAKVGTQEGGKVLIFKILQLDPTKGFALGIARRIRELFWSFVGLALLSRHQRRSGSAAS
jgi:glycosyltransferase 2 family protein